MHCCISLFSPTISWVDRWFGKLQWFVVRIPHSKFPRLSILMNTTLHFALVSFHDKVYPCSGKFPKFFHEHYPTTVKLRYNEPKSNENLPITDLTGLTKLGRRRWKLVEKSVRNGDIINPSNVYHLFVFILST